MKTIGFITEDYWRGGLARFNANLIQHWPDKDTRLIIFTNRQNPAIKEFAGNPHVDIIYFDFDTVSSGVGKEQSPFRKLFNKTIFKYGFFAIRYFTLRKIFRQYDIDYWFISNGGYPGSDLCRLSLLVLKQHKGVFVFHGMVQKPRLFFTFVERLIDKMVFHNNNFNLVTVSGANANSIVHRPWIGDVSVKVIYNGIEQPDNIKDHQLSSKEPVVSMLSGLRSYKGQKVIIQAAEKLKSEGFELKVRFYGSDFKRFTDEIEEMINSSSYPDMFFLPGFYSVDKIMEEADLVVVPSLVYESFGYTAVEAMAYGIPVIASDVGGLPEVIGDAGIICEAGNVSKWTVAIRDVLTNQKLRIDLIKKGIGRSRENFRVEDMVSEYKKLIFSDEKDITLFK